MAATTLLFAKAMQHAGRNIMEREEHYSATSRFFLLISKSHMQLVHRIVCDVSARQQVHFKSWQLRMV